MPNINIPLTIVGTAEETLLPDGTVYQTGALGDYPRSIGEKKRIVWAFSTTYAAGLNDTNWWVYVGVAKQGVITPILTKVPIFHSMSVIGTFTPGLYPMAMDVPVGSNPNVNNNCQVFLEVLTSTTFNIIVEFYMIYDETTMQNVSYQNNHNKLLMDMKTATSELTVSAATNMYLSLIHI